MSRRILLALLLPAWLAAASCSSTPPKASSSRINRDFKTLEAVVTDRIFASPGSPGTTISGNGSWFLEFEAKDGDATAHYRFQVTRDQYNRYHEGQRVQLIVANEELRDIRPLN